MKNKYKKIGILGGMGPAASAHFLQRIIGCAQNNYKAVQDNDYPEIVLNSIALNDFDECGNLNDGKILNQLIESLKVMEIAGAELICIACNTVHTFQKHFEDEFSIPFISIIDETVKEVKDNNLRKVAVLSSRETNKLELYKQALVTKNIDCVVSDENEQKVLDDLILKVMSGQINDEQSLTLEKIVETKLNKGVEAIVLGCTELPLIPLPENLNTKIYNTLDILTESVLKYSYGY